MEPQSLEFPRPARVA